MKKLDIYKVDRYTKWSSPFYTYKKKEKQDWFASQTEIFDCNIIAVFYFDFFSNLEQRTHICPQWRARKYFAIICKYL